MTYLKICDWECGCGFCGCDINKGDKYLQIDKSAWKGTTRVNICQFCILKIFIELAPSKKDVQDIKRLIILENLK